MIEDGEDSRLPPAHPAFVAHFTNRLYDTDAAENDDVPPFGTDEGFDEVHEWAERLDELRQHPTLRHMLGEDADEAIQELRDVRQVDVDDILIGQGFTLLRFTGQIDDEGRGWLLEALDRQDRRQPGGEYAIMMKDVETFANQHTKAAPAGGRLTSGKPKKTKPWLSITGTNDDDLERWFTAVARAVADDPDWQAWWTGSGVDYLLIYPSPLGPPGQDLTTIDRRGSRLEVLGSSAALAEIMWPFLNAAERGEDVPLDMLNTPEVRALFRSLIHRLLREAGDHLGMPTPPDRLPGW